VDSEEGATSLGGTTVPTVTTTATTATTTVGTTMTTTATTMPDSDSDTSDDSETSAGSSPSGTSEDPTNDTSASATGPDEQPADGLYSECESTANCFGATVCVPVMPPLGFCSDNCAISGDCAPSPGGTAAQACVTASVGGADMMVCALDCSGGKTCPGGMACLPLGASMVCA
jgi:hypothetical protein